MAKKPDVKKEKEFYKVREVAELLDISLPTAYRWVNEGYLQAVKIGRTVRIPREAIEQMKSESLQAEVVPGEE